VKRDGYRAAVWNDGVITDLPAPRISAAYGMNDAGQVVGFITLKNHVDHAALWSPDGTLTDLGNLFDSTSDTADVINANGDCALSAAVEIDGRLVRHVFFAPGCGNPVDIGTLGGATNQITGINVHDELAGLMTLDPSSTLTHAITWSNGVLTDMGLCRDMDASGSEGINDSGHVVGFCYSENKNLRRTYDGFYFDGTDMIRIGSLGGEQSEAMGINNADVIVGRSQTPSGDWHPFVLDRGSHGHRLHDLQTMLDASGTGWALDWASKINDAGQILVSGRLNGSKTRDALLTPVN
jgi:probable HAF family extracellular repeat protein